MWHPSNTIAGFFGPYRFLSNFYAAPQYTDGVWWPTNEHYFQFRKATTDLEYWKTEILKKENASWAKHIGCYKMPIPSNWADIKDDCMIEGLYSKFKIPRLRQLLLDTDPLTLIEENNWNDTYWGVCRGVGLNRLGELLMEVRATILLQGTYDEEHEEASKYYDFSNYGF